MNLSDNDRFAFGFSADDSQKAIAPVDSSAGIPAANSDSSELEQQIAKLQSLFGHFGYGYWYFLAQSRVGLEEVLARVAGSELPSGADTLLQSDRPLRSKGEGERL